jgi:hypothetical protein
MQANIVGNDPSSATLVNANHVGFDGADLTTIEIDHLSVDGLPFLRPSFLFAHHVPRLRKKMGIHQNIGGGAQASTSGIVPVRHWVVNLSLTELKRHVKLANWPKI